MTVAASNLLASLPAESLQRMATQLAQVAPGAVVTFTGEDGECLVRAGENAPCPASGCRPGQVTTCAEGWHRLHVPVIQRGRECGQVWACLPGGAEADLTPLLRLAALRLADQAVAGWELRNLSREIVSNYEQLSWLCRAATDFGAGSSTERICERLVDEVMEQLRPENAMVALVHPETGQPRTYACAGDPTDAYVVPAAHMSEGILAHVLATGEPAIVCNVIHSAPPPLTGSLVGSVLCVPLVSGGKVLGAICARDKLSGEEFFAVDLKLATAIASHSAMAISNSVLFQDIKELFLGTVRSLASAVDAKDPYTLGHSQRVTRTALAIAEELNFPAEGQEDIQLAGLLHDVGKIGMPDHILLKPGRLNDEEWAEVKKHPTRGEEILRPIKQMSRVATWIRHEHERWDGSGYPDGLRGHEIPLASRIIAVADAFDALTSDRSYRPAVAADVAARKLQAASGTDYDPAVVQAFLRAYERGRVQPGLGLDQVGPDVAPPAANSK